MSDLQDELDRHEAAHWNNRLTKDSLIVEAARESIKLKDALVRTNAALARRDAQIAKYANPDYLAAAIGHGIDLQEATDIVDLALAGRKKLSTFRRQLYDEALGVTDADENTDVDRS